MQRSWLVPLTVIALHSASCGTIWSPPPAPRLAETRPAAVQASVAAATSEQQTRAPAVVDEIVAFLSRHRTGLTGVETRTVARAILEESARRDLDPRLVLALIYVESRYNSFAVSKVGALGLMQILPSTGEELARREGIAWEGPHILFDPVVNVRLGTAYLRELADRFGSLRAALAAYNWGPGHVDRRLRRGTPLPRVYPGLVLAAFDEVVPERSSS